MTSSPTSLSATAKGHKVYGVGALIALAVLFIGITILLTFLLR